MILLKLHLKYSYIEKQFHDVKDAYSFIKDLGREVMSYQLETI